MYLLPEVGKCGNDGVNNNIIQLNPFPVFRVIKSRGPRNCCRLYFLEGWWKVGALLFDSGRFVETRDAFAHFISLDPALASAYSA